jgi:prophage antirepressor-like protein
MCFLFKNILLHKGINTFSLMETDITDPNCIVKAFENNNISIIKDENNKYFFRGTDVAKALEITNIRSSIQNFTSKEKGVRKVDTLGGPQDIIFLSSHGIYRLLYSSKKKIAEHFREWVGDILDDIIFNESTELKRQLENQKKITKLEVENTLKTSNDKRKVVYIIKIYEDNNLYKFGYTDDIVTRLRSHKNKIGEHIELIYCIESENNKLLEQEFKDYLEKCNYRTKKTINNSLQTELFTINDINIIKNELVKMNNTIQDDKALIIKLKSEILDLRIELSKTDETKLQELKDEVTELKRENDELKEKILDLKLSMQKENTTLIKNIDTVENRIYKKRKVDKIDPSTLKVIETYDCINAILANNPNKNYSYNQIYRSIKKNNVYKDFRWNYNGEKINPTNKIVIDGNKIEKVIQLDKNKNFVKIYQTKSELCKLLHIGIVKLNKYIEEEKILNEFYYANESCYSGEILDECVNYEIHNCKHIRETNIETNEIIIYKSMKELYDKRGISRCTLRNCIKNNRVCDKYKWEYVNPQQNKNNSKRIKETNIETNEIIIYDSMKQVNIKRQLYEGSLKYHIRKNIILNGYKYEFNLT